MGRQKKKFQAENPTFGAISLHLVLISCDGVGVGVLMRFSSTMPFWCTI